MKCECVCVCVCIMLSSVYSCLTPNVPGVGSGSILTLTRHIRKMNKYELNDCIACPGKMLLIQHLASSLLQSADLPILEKHLSDILLFLFYFIFCVMVFVAILTGRIYIHNQGSMKLRLLFFQAFVFHCVPKISPVICISKNNF